MPIRAPRACDFPSCLAHAIKNSWYCDKHQPVREDREADKQRYAADPVKRGLYNTPGWEGLKEWKKSNEPVCEVCKRERTAVIDHRLDHKGNAKLFFSRENLVGMCKTCHDRKTGLTQGGKKVHAETCRMRQPPGWVCTCGVGASVPVYP